MWLWTGVEQAQFILLSLEQHMSPCVRAGSDLFTPLGMKLWAESSPCSKHLMGGCLPAASFPPEELSTKEFLMFYFVAYSKPIFLLSVKFASCRVVSGGICPTKYLSWKQPFFFSVNDAKCSAYSSLRLRPQGGDGKLQSIARIAPHSRLRLQAKGVSCDGSTVCSNKLQEDIPPGQCQVRREEVAMPLPWDPTDSPQLQLRPTDRIHGGDGPLWVLVLCTMINLECGFPVLGRGGGYYLAYLSPLCSDVCNPPVAMSNSKPAGNALRCVFSPSCFFFSKALPGFSKSSGCRHHFAALVCTASIAMAVWPGQSKELYLLNMYIVSPLLFRIPLCATAFLLPRPRHLIVLWVEASWASWLNNFSASPSNIIKIYLVFRDLDPDLL